MRNDILDSLHLAQKLNPLSAESFTHKDHMVYDRDNLVKVYMQYQKANMSNITLSTKENLTSSINEVVKNLGAKKMLFARNLDFTDLDSINCDKVIYDFSVDSDRDSIFELNTSILQARVGVANLGIVGLSTGSLNPRLISLVVSECIILLKKEDIVANYFEAFSVLKDKNTGEIPSNIVFLAGPSRTADIELKTVFGVHGPRKIEIIIY